MSDVLRHWIPDGKVVDGWRVVRRHRSGASGVVYRVVRDGTRGPERALKIRNPTSACCTRAEFEREIALFRTLPLGDAQPAFHGCGTYEGEPYYVMEFAEMLPQGMGPEASYRYFRAIAVGLAGLGKRFLFHGDVKPDNLGVCLRGLRKCPVLFDLGSCREWVRNLADPLATTRAYLHDDVKATGIYTFRDDLRALAQVMQKHCNAAAKERYAPAIESALRKNESSTLQSVADFIDLLDDCHRKNLRRTVLLRCVYCGAFLALVGGLLLVGLKVRSGREEQVVGDFEASRAEEYIAGELAQSDSVTHTNAEQWVAAAAATSAQAEAWVEEGRRLYEKKAYAEALKLFEKAARTPGYENAYVYGKIAECYFRGRGCARDRDVSRKYARWAADLGDETGAKILRSFKDRPSREDR